MKNWLIKIWNDNVGAGIITACVIWLAGLVWSRFANVNYFETVKKIFLYPVAVGWLLVSLIGISILKKLFGFKRKSIKQRRIEKFKKEHTRFDFNDGIMFRFKTYFGDDNLPFIFEPKPYCTLHDWPIKMSRQGCDESGCKNAFVKVEITTNKNFIESIYINEWEKLNGIY